MRVRSIFITALFFSALLGSALAGDAEEPPSDVVKLTKDNFEEVINSKDQLVFVKFFAPWCTHCQQMANDFKEVATELKGKVVLGDVDATVEEDIARKYDVEGFPTLKIFSNGQVLADYNGERTKDSMIKFIDRATRPSFDELSEASEVSELLSTHAGKNVLVAVNLDAEQMGRFKKSTFSIRDVMPDDVSFAHIMSKEALKHDGLKGATVNDNEIYLFKHVEGEEVHKVMRYQFSDKASHELEDDGVPTMSSENGSTSIEYFVKSNTIPKFQEFTQENAELYTELTVPLIIGFFESCDESEECQILEQVARDRADPKKIVFAWANKVSLVAFLEYVGLESAPLQVCAYDFADDLKYFLPKSEDWAFSKESITEWVDSILNGTAVTERKSEPIPETQEGPLYKVVGETWEKIVESDTKEQDVLIAQIAQWDEDSAALNPILRNLATLFKEKDITSVLFASMDGTENDASDKYKAEEDFPIIHFFKKDSSDGVLYEGKKTGKDIVQFIIDNASEKINFDVDSLGPDPTPDDIEDEDDEDLEPDEVEYEDGLEPDDFSEEDDDPASDIYDEDEGEAGSHGEAEKEDL